MGWAERFKQDLVQKLEEKVLFAEGENKVLVIVRTEEDIEQVNELFKRTANALGAIEVFWERIMDVDDSDTISEVEFAKQMEDPLMQLMNAIMLYYPNSQQFRDDIKAFRDIMVRK